MGQVGGQGGERPDQGGQVLAGLDRAQPEQVRAVQAEAAAQLGNPLGGGGAQVGAERGHVDPVGGHVEPFRQVGRGGRGHAQHPVGGGHGPAHGPAEVADLAGLVPLGVGEQGQVVDRHHRGQAGPQGQLVVDAVEQVGPGPPGRPAGQQLGPGDPGRPPRPGHGHRPQRAAQGRPAPRPTRARRTPPPPGRRGRPARPAPGPRTPRPRSAAPAPPSRPRHRAPPARHPWRSATSR